MDKKIIFIISFAFSITALVILLFNFQKNQTAPIKNTAVNIIPSEKEVISQHMKLTSPSFLNNQMMPSKYTCDGENISPPLVVEGIPPQTQSLALIVDDPDAPSGNFIHWLIWNIAPKTEKITEGEVPNEASQGINDFGENKYGGPCPPSGIHRYQFKLYALDVLLDLPENTKGEDLEKAIEGHILDQTMLVGNYQKK